MVCILFIDEMGIKSSEDRELILSKIYDLKNPAPATNEEDLTSKICTSPNDPFYFQIYCSSSVDHIVIKGHSSHYLDVLNQYEEFNLQLFI